jgi:modulator of FtsH protease HflC
MSKQIVAVVAVVVALLALNSTAVFVDETEHVLVTEFGKYKRVVSKAGLTFKLPWQTLIRLPRRILARDTLPQIYLTKDKKRLVADPITRWKVSNPLEFYKSVADERGAYRRLDDWVQSELRQELARQTMGDMVGHARNSMMATVTKRTQTRATALGIEIVDVRIKHLDLPKQVQQSVFDRMKAERERLAKGYRAQGQERADEITSNADKQQRIIIAEARRKAEETRGQGDALATKIYAEAFGEDPEFYAFVRNLQAYEKSLSADATVVLSTGSNLFRYLTSPGKSKGVATP